MANPPRIRNYQDLRYKFMRGLIRHEHQQRRHQFLKQAAEWTSKAIVSLSLASEPIRSAKQATQLEGVGAIIRSRLDKIQAENNIKADPPNPGQHVSTGSGLLVALLNESEATGSSEGGKPLVPEPDLKEACELICQEKFNKIQTSTDGTPVLCPAWWRINVLISRGYVKKRTRGKQAVYELLPEGEQIARTLRGNHPPPIRIRIAPPLPQSPATKGRKKTPSKKKATESSSGNPCVTEPTAASSASNFKGPLYSHDRGTDGVLMLVDDHELGGDRVRLEEMCRRLKGWDIQHKTAHLPCGDYLWLWRENGKEVALPILVERKRADDLAGSIKDGRYLSQKDKMRQWREEFGMLSNEVSLQYVVESTPEAYRVKCMDGCNGVGKCGNPTVQQVEVAIKELENNKDFTLIKTENLEITVEYLASITAELQQRVTNGDFQALRLMNQDRPLPLTDMRSKSTASKRSRVTATSTKTIADSPTTAHAPKNKFSSNHQTTHAQKVNTKTRDYERTAHAQAQTQHTASSSGSSSSLHNAGNKRRASYIAIDVDEILEEIPKKSKKVVNIELLDDSQEDYLYEKSPFDNSSSKPGSSRNVNSVRESSPYMVNSSRKYSPPINPTNQVKVNSNNDEEAKIVAIRDVIPDASLDAILSALCSSGGNIELAVAKLLDNPGNHDRADRF